MAPSPTSSPPRKRTRPPKSCRACRKRKIACDKKLPCGSCVRSRAALQCSYRPDDAAGNSGGKARSLAPAARPSLAVASPIQAQQPIATSSEPRGSDANQQHEDVVEELQLRIRHLEELVCQKQPDSHGPAGNPGTKSREASPPCSSPPKAAPLRLRSTSTKTRLFGQSHWHYIADHFSLFRFDAQAEPAIADGKSELNTLIADARKLRHRYKAYSTGLFEQPVPNLLESLPRREVCDSLVSCYLRTFEPIFRIMHVPSFWKCYNACWEAPHGFSATPTHFLMKLVLILAIGTTFYTSPIATERSELTKKAQTWMYAAQWWLIGPAERTAQTLDGLQVCCLLMLARQSIHNSPGVAGWISTGSLISMSIMLGLHCNPDLFKNLSIFEREMRRRLWTTVLELSLLHSLDLATPLPLCIDDLGTHLPSNLDDEDIDPDREDVPAARSALTDSSLQLLLSKTLALRMGVVRQVNNLPTEEQYDAVLKHGEDLRAACRDVTAFFQAHDSASTGGLKLSRFHQKLLDIYMHKYLIALYAPFMIQARSDPKLYFARKACLESAFVLASYADDMDFAAPPTKPDDFAQLSIMGRGLFKGALGNDVVMILCLEVTTQLEDAGAAPGHLDQLHRARRAPLVSVLKTVHNRLTQIHAQGNIGLIRLGFLTGFLAQIGALEKGEPVAATVYSSLTNGMREWNERMRRALDQLSSRLAVPGIPNDGDIPGWDLDSEPTHSYNMDWGILDPNSTWDSTGFWDLQF